MQPYAESETKKKKRPKGVLPLFFFRGFFAILLTVMLYGVVAIVAVQGGREIYAFTNQVFGDVIMEAPPGNTVRFTIHDTDTPMTVAKNLKSYNLIPNEYSFYIRLRLSLSDSAIMMSGTYDLNTSMTYKEILDVIVKGTSSETGTAG